MILRWSSSENDATLAKKSRGCDKALGVRPVRAEQDPLDRQVSGQVFDVVLDEWRHPAVLDELLDRVRGEHPGILTAQHVQRVEAPWHPVRPVLDVGDLEAGKALEQLVCHQHGGEVLDQPVLHELGHQRGRLDGGRVRTAAALRCDVRCPMSGRCPPPRRCSRPRTRHASSRQCRTLGPGPRTRRRPDPPGSATPQA